MVSLYGIDSGDTPSWHIGTSIAIMTGTITSIFCAQLCSILFRRYKAWLNLLLDAAQDARNPPLLSPIKTDPRS